MRKFSTYSSSSPFVQEYAIDRSGLDDSLPMSSVIDSSEKVVIVDALLRKHYTELSVSELAQVTGISESSVEECIGSLVDSGLAVSDDGSYSIKKGRGEVKRLREIQINMLGDSVSKE